MSIGCDPQRLLWGYKTGEGEGDEQAGMRDAYPYPWILNTHSQPLPKWVRHNYFLTSQFAPVNVKTLSDRCLKKAQGELPKSINHGRKKLSHITPIQDGAIRKPPSPAATGCLPEPEKTSSPMPPSLHGSLYITLSCDIVHLYLIS